MNLVVSGPIGDSLRNVVVGLSIPRNVVRLHSRAYRLEGADDSPTVRAQVAELCDAARVDHAYVEEGLRFSDFRLLAMDMDSTLITIECIDEIADFVGKKKEVAAITEAAMRGEITDFAESLRRRVALLAGTPRRVLRQVYDERLKYSPGAESLITRARDVRMHTLLVSGGFTYFTSKIKHALRLDYAHANRLEIKANKLSGKLLGPIVDAEAKASFLSKTLQFNAISASHCLTIGDGANDIEMFSIANSSIAYHGKEIVRTSAKLKIDFGGLDTVLDYYS